MPSWIKRLGNGRMFHVVLDSAAVTCRINRHPSDLSARDFAARRMIRRHHYTKVTLEHFASMG
jgi:hypothetical protein